MKNYIIILALTITSLFAACNKPIEIPTDIPEELKPYLSAYTSGVISRSSAVRISFTDSIVAKYLADSSLIKSCLKLSPSFDYNIKVSSGNLLIVTPKKWLKPSTRYKATFNIEKLLGIKAKNKTLDLVFETQALNYTHTINNIEPSAKNVKSIGIDGSVKLNDVIKYDEIKDAIKATINGRSYPVKVKRKSNVEYYFTVYNVLKQKKENQLILKIDGSKFNSKRIENDTIMIPAQGDFKILANTLSIRPELKLTLTFSEYLDKNQDLKGLIAFDKNISFKTMIEKNKIHLFIEEYQAGNYNITIHKGIKNIEGHKLIKDLHTSIELNHVKPSIELIGDGTILPNSQGLFIPFKTIGLTKVKVTVFKIFSKNILQFLQVNDLEESDELQRVGEIVATKTINLGLNDSVISWETHSLQLDKLIKKEPGAIYRVKFAIAPGFTQEKCGENDAGLANYSNHHYNYYENSSWDEIDDYGICDRHFYYSSTKSKNILASDLGILAKKGDNGKLTVFTTDLEQGTPKTEVSVSLYSYNKKLISKGKTNANGRFTFKPKENVHVIVAKHAGHVNYLKISGNNLNSLSRFEIYGSQRQNGVSGFMYGERGVWRPGDKMYLSLIINDEKNNIPNNLTTEILFRNPKGVVVSKKRIKTNKNGITSFQLQTKPSDPTGNYSVQCKTGVYTFNKYLKVESIRPNRLKVNLRHQKSLDLKTNNTASLEGQWLNGLPASNLKAEVELKLNQKAFYSATFPNYTFSDPTKRFTGYSSVVLNQKLDSNGMAIVTLPAVNSNFSGILHAEFGMKVFEKGGGFSANQYATNINVHKTYLGMKRMNNMQCGMNNKIGIAMVDENGKPIKKSQKLKVKVYKIEWNWWWRNKDNELASYIKNASHNLFLDSTLECVNGTATLDLFVKDYEYGQYFIQVANSSGYSCAQTAYVNSYRYQEQEDQGMDNASLLTLKLNKNNYNVNEQAVLSFPSPINGKALVSLENDMGVIKSYWINTQKGVTKTKIDIHKSMAPNCYVSISVLQPHKHFSNDLPIRMYGVAPLKVYDKNSELKPQLNIADHIEPDKMNRIQISERSGKGMYYTIAIVDEGLLDLTNYKTPRIWKYFNQERSLGVSTYDVYDKVINAFEGRFNSKFSIGGDADANAVKGVFKANRFKPVVKHLGPFYLKPNSKASHNFTIENYIGAVRAMVVARGTNTYGSNSKLIRVKKDVMLQSSLPRVLNPGDKIKIPVTVFVNNNKELPVKVSVQENGFFTLSKKEITITNVKNKEKTVFFDAVIKQKFGVAKLTLRAKGTKTSHQEKTEIAVRLPGYPVVEYQDSIINSNIELSYTLKNIGFEGTNSITVELSKFPSINLKERLHYLVQYPHGCVEQTTSSVFPQLYLEKLTELPAARKKEISRNINHAILRLGRFQTISGGLAYWPGNLESNQWGTNYAGHFLIEAQKKGFFVPQHFMNKWYSYQNKLASDYDFKTNTTNHLTQAYRLFLLALHGKANVGAMNRLKEQKLNIQSQWRLAAAYALIGQKNIAKTMVNTLEYSVPSYRELSYTYGSNFRDDAMILESMQAIGMDKKAFSQSLKIAKQLGRNRWMSTQEVAYALCAVSKVIDKSNASPINAEVTLNGTSTILKGTNPILSATYKDLRSANSLKVKNLSGAKIFAKISNKGVPNSNNIKSSNNKISLISVWYDMQNNQVNPNRLTFGQDYKIITKIKNQSNTEDLKELALTTLLPSGCEIINARMQGARSTNQVDFEDIRDDRIFTYFDLRPSQIKTITYKVNASFPGTFGSIGLMCEAMYDASIYANIKGSEVVISEPT